MKLIQLALYDDGYIWVNPEEVRCVRTDYNSIDKYNRTYCYLQFKDGLEYKLNHSGPVTIEYLHNG